VCSSDLVSFESPLNSLTGIEWTGQFYLTCIEWTGQFYYLIWTSFLAYLNYHFLYFNLM